MLLIDIYNQLLRELNTRIRVYLLIDGIVNTPK